MTSPNPEPPCTLLYIKHMVCPRGIRMVRRELEQLGLRVLDVRLGAATVAAAAEELDWPRIRQVLADAQFALLETEHQTLLERVHTATGHLLRRPEPLRHRAFGPALAHELSLSYGQLSAAYARLAPGDTLAAYISRQRLVYAQELLITSSSGVGRIAHQLGYSSLAHFSGQFRRVARCAPSAYRKQQRALTTGTPAESSK
ncbi:helix-turn-helix domain-containing protein [Hymenobacter busanensis]|uniref:Helix-turn-helix domain-containing protein n=1 Tax=Hymenobacter busanensis TaxID=2607656 RepID=A0AA88JXP9_9BACT|nr:helix-turn-helix domain-containing protein [Hymenobacter busanensis]KAA9325118.1 helix-turn-helix domain-containing protein [Hymenobacter busanensis]